MDKLKKQLFIKTDKLYRAYQRADDSPLYTDLDTLSLRVKYQTLYGFIYESGLEDEYLEWRSELTDN